MNKTGPNTTADLFFQLRWQSPAVRHSDAYSAHHVNFRRDLLPEDLHHQLQGKPPGDMIHLTVPAHGVVENMGGAGVRTISRKQFDPHRIRRPSLEPYIGRFYPQGLLKDMPGIFPANMAPFRCVDINNGHLTVHMGHPLAGKQLDLRVTVGGVQPKTDERGGTLRNWGEIITQGVGMQARWEDTPTRFFDGNAFKRLDERPDPLFYEHPRLIQHIDDTAIDMVRQIHGRFAKEGMAVLDLMSSWQTHLPEGIGFKSVTGIGLNAVELQHNKKLTDYRVHDLNHDPRLPLDDAAYDMALCSASVEYLTDPLTFFAETARVLKPGGYFIVTFSNRWFEPKTIRLWTELHEFERMGLVLEYFRHQGLFEDLQTYSVRGLIRPATDKYCGVNPYSDPVYAVWGRRK